MFELRPSASHIWTNCHAMPRLALLAPEQEPSDASREGTCAAWVAECVLKGEFATTHEMVDMSHENGWLVEPDMADHIQGYVDHFVRRGGTINVERVVVLNDMIKGTPDGFAVLSDDLHLYVDDLKYGYLIVEPYMNPQCTIYGGAIVRMLATSGVHVRQVTIGIYQPRPYHPDGPYRKWNIDVENFMSFVKEIETDGHQCQDLTVMATPGDHCMYCPAAGVCAANAFTNYKNVSVVRDERGGQMTAREISSEMDFLDKALTILTARQSAVKTEIIARKRKGEFIPHYGFEEGFGNRVFTVPEKMVADLSGVDIYVKPKTASPAEVERRMKLVGKDPAVLTGMVKQPRKAPKLTRLSSDHFTNLFKHRIPD